MKYRVTTAFSVDKIEADDTEVSEDGTLALYRDEGNIVGVRRVAIYAPGQWYKVEVVDD